MSVVPSSPLHAPARGGNARSPSPGPVNQPDIPFVENLASPFSPRSPRAVKPRVGALDFYDTFAIPPAPQWSEVRPRRRAGPCDENIDVSLRAFDPTTIFVGGLEVHGRCTWDEQRLKSVFGQYGEIVEVKLVRPGG
jgi:RNA recognition motif-containing protein